MTHFHLIPSGESWLPGEAQVISKYSSNLCIVSQGMLQAEKYHVNEKNEQVQLGERVQEKHGGDKKVRNQGICNEGILRSSETASAFLRTRQ